MKTKRLTRTALATALAASMLTIALPPPAFATAPDRNGLIAFWAQTGAGEQLFTVHPNGHGMRQITHVNGDAAHPHWSPDGSRLVFELDTPDSGNLAFINADGSGLVQIPAAAHGFEGQPTFTPDGNRVVFERYDAVTNDDAIWSMKLDGTDRVRVVSGPAGASAPSVSPDGQTLSFVSFDGNEFGQALATSRLDGSQQHQLTPFALDVAVKQDWAPDGQHLVLSDNADIAEQSANLATIRPDGTELTYLTHFTDGTTRAYAGSYSPDGQWIVYRLEQGGEYALMRMRPDGSDKHTILPFSDFRPRAIDWGSRVTSQGSGS